MPLINQFESGTVMCSRKKKIIWCSWIYWKAVNLWINSTVKCQWAFLRIVKYAAKRSLFPEGSFSNHYGNAEGNVDWRMNLYLTYETRDNLESCGLSITIRAISKLNNDKLEKEILKKDWSSVVDVLQTTQNLVMSRCYFEEKGRLAVYPLPLPFWFA